MKIFSSFFLSLFIANLSATTLQEGYVIPKETLSPSGCYGFVVPVLDIYSDTNNLSDSLVFTKTGKVIAVIDALPGFDRRVNHIKIAAPWWSKDESLVLWKVEGKRSPWALVLIHLKHGTQAWQLNLLTAFQKEILARTKAIAPEKYEAVKKKNAGDGAVFPDGFTVDVEPVVKSDSDQQPWLKLPLEVHVTLTSNPKQLENVLTLNSEMDGVIKQEGVIEIKNFKLL
ncbi:MAG: hypothetical protein ACH346_05595 [Chthoniobacterales bacterium]